MPIRRCRTCPDCSPRENAAAGLHGANRLGGNSLSDLLVFGKRAGEYAAEFAKENTLGAVNTDQVDAAARRALAALRAAHGRKSVSAFSMTLQELMQDLVGIVRQEEEMAAGARSGSRN